MWYDEVDKKEQVNNPYDFQFELEQVTELIDDKKNIEEWFDALYNVLHKWDINTRYRVCGFISQCGHESAGFTRLTENLNYSWQSLMRVFGSRYFDSEDDAKRYHRNQEMIANHVYMDKNRSPRGALGNTEPGDGWRFRGRGLIQLTGRSNFSRFGKSIGLTAEEAVEYAGTPKGAVESACWFWSQNNINEYADECDVKGMSRAINGGYNGLDDRIHRWEKALENIGK